MPRLTNEIRRLIGVATPDTALCDVVEPGAVRRFAQATGDIDPLYASGEAAGSSKYKGPIAPPLYPLNMLRTPFGAPDPIEARARDPHFDGATEMSTYGLPPLPLENSPIVNGGVEVEFSRYARHGERVSLRARYKDIYEKETSKGWMIFVVYEATFLGEDGLPILTINRTQIRR
ncbi:MAG: MaoC family dehydratase N-terminal domain-containing protein [Xanthobacteraceae bacterium]|nr:MaoC family dehydratase N-terminal domain-containing protein [Xanthobacteraceae bacterium]